jgi:hypothetical protein
MLMVAPWFGWSLARVAHNSYSAGSTSLASNIFSGLAASEKLIVLSHNLLLLLASPFSLLTGFTNTFSVIGTVLILIWCLFVRRQLMPDLFVAFYCLMLLCWTRPPERFVAPILPLVLWIVWRVFRLIKAQEALAALVVIGALLPLGANAARIPSARANGYFEPAGVPADNWNEMQKLFSFIRRNTEVDSVLLANQDGEVFLNTGRRAIRGFAPNGFNLFYATHQSAVTPDQLSNAIVQAHVQYVVLTPDRGLAESASFHKSVEALERGGVVEPVGIPGITPDYRLLRITH